MLSCLSHVQLFATAGTVARQAPLSMEFPRQEYWSMLPFPTPWDLPNPGIKPKSCESSSLAGRFFISEPPGKPLNHWTSREVLVSIVLICMVPSEVQGLLYLFFCELYIFSLQVFPALRLLYASSLKGKIYISTCFC